MGYIVRIYFCYPLQESIYSVTPFRTVSLGHKAIVTPGSLYILYDHVTHLYRYNSKSSIMSNFDGPDISFVNYSNITP